MSLTYSTNLHIAFWANNTLYNNLHNKEPQDMDNTSGIYKMKCKTYNNSILARLAYFPLSDVGNM